VTSQRTVRSKPAPEAARLLARTCLALAGLAGIWFAINVVHPVGPEALLWATVPAYGPLLTVIFWLTGRSAPLPAGTRRLWLHLSPVPILVATGQGLQVVDVLRHPGVPGSHMTSAMLIVDGIAVLLMIHAFGRLPLGATDRGATFRIVLDAGTIALAATVFVWHFSTRYNFTGNSGLHAYTALMLIVLTLLGMATATKVLLGGYSAINARGLRLLTGAVAVGALSPLLQPLLPTAGARLYISELHLPIVFALGSYAAVSQWRTTGRRPQRPPRRPYSVLPYAAVAAVDVLLLVVATTDRQDVVVVAAGAVALTMLVAVRQLTALRDNARLLARVDHLANHDALTGLANRALVQRRLTEALAAADGRPVSVALLDLDGFKQVNDTLGHEAGDLLLIAVARRLAAGVRAGDTVARLGGDEFVIVLDDAGPETAAEIAERLVAGLAEPVRLADCELPVRASIGIASDHAGADPGRLLRRADQAMYAAKKLAGTAYLHYAEPMALTAH
jgi:diguanylate cyclase (GGDEF)-like protein